eukprot:g4303.t1
MVQPRKANGLHGILYVMTLVTCIQKVVEYYLLVFFPVCREATRILTGCTNRTNYVRDFHVFLRFLKMQLVEDRSPTIFRQLQQWPRLTHSLLLERYFCLQAWTFSLLLHLHSQNLARSQTEGTRGIDFPTKKKKTVEVFWIFALFLTPVSFGRFILINFGMNESWMCIVSLDKFFGV